MCRLLETIKLKEGRLYNLDFHNQRLNSARKSLFGNVEYLDLRELIQAPEEKKNGLYRCRILYGLNIEKVEFLPHQFRPVTSLQLVEDHTIDYRFKYADRSHLSRLFALRGDCDDILIIQNGYITDSYTANAIFYDGRRWWTPHTPLLAGTQRARLLSEQRIRERPITPADLPHFQKIGLINALQDIEDMPVIRTDRVFHSF